MDGKKLVRMANDIGAFFAAEPDEKVARAAIAGHLQRFWEPRMRREIYAVIGRGPDHGLKEIVVAALEEHRGKLEPKEARAGGVPGT